MDYHKKYLKYKTKYFQLKNQTNYNMVGGNNKNTVYLFKADWCPHCIAFKPTWKTLQQNMEDKINFVTIDSEKNKEEIKNFGVSGFPTIMLKTNDKVIEYVGDRSLDGLKEFINNY